MITTDYTPNTISEVSYSDGAITIIYFDQKGRCTLSFFASVDFYQNLCSTRISNSTLKFYEVQYHNGAIQYARIEYIPNGTCQRYFVTFGVKLENTNTGSPKVGMA